MQESETFSPFRKLDFIPVVTKGTPSLMPNGIEKNPGPEVADG
jgi:hypothetical protein